MTLRIAADTVLGLALSALALRSPEIVPRKQAMAPPDEGLARRRAAGAWGPSVLSLFALVAASGCLSGDSGGGRDDEVRECPFPIPCGNEWPEGLTGPFQLEAGYPAVVEVESHDGTVLRGWLWLPDLPEGVGAPVVLISSPYHGGNTEAPADHSGGAGAHSRYVGEGYAVAEFSVRGTGLSGGCFQNKGMDEQLDQPVLVEWLAGQAWSNGRVAMAGTSYPGTTPIMAAIHHAPSLATIVINGPVTDPYTELHTPQGALYTMGGPYETGRRGLVSLNPQALLTIPSEGPAAGVGIAAERLCTDVAKVYLEAERGHFTDDRDGDFWRERQLIFGMPDVTTPVFLSHGLQETAHPFQEDIAWESLPNAPKRMLLGQWDHEYPRVADWQGEILGWLDYWLKGIGDEAPGLGVVTFQDDAGAWHNSSAWPPLDADEAHLFPGGHGWGPVVEQGTAVASFRLLPPPPREHTGAPLDHVCGTAPPGTGLVIPLATASRVTGPALIAGNPWLWLSVEADQPGGILSAHVYALQDGAPCDAARPLTFGTADLRFHIGGYQGTAFPLDSPTPVRIDLNNVAAAIGPDDGIYVVLSYGDSLGTDEVADPLTDARVSRSGQPYFPEVTLHTDAGMPSGGWTTLMLPLVGGDVAGGPAPTGVPSRPFSP